MAQGPQEAITRARRALVLDANILLRAVLGRRARDLILRYAEDVALLTPSIAVEDAREYLPVLCATRRWPLAPALEVFEQLLALVRVVEIEFLGHMEDEARARISVRDPEDCRCSRWRWPSTRQSGPRIRTSSARVWPPGPPRRSNCISPGATAESPTVQR